MTYGVLLSKKERNKVTSLHGTINFDLRKELGKVEMILKPNPMGIFSIGSNYTIHYQQDGIEMAHFHFYSPSLEKLKNYAEKQAKHLKKKGYETEVKCPKIEDTPNIEMPKVEMSVKMSKLPKTYKVSYVAYDTENSEIDRGEVKTIGDLLKFGENCKRINFTAYDKNDNIITQGDFFK